MGDAMQVKEVIFLGTGTSGISYFLQEIFHLKCILGFHFVVAE
jgi:hypothetical protein